MHIDVTEPGAFERLLTLRLDEDELESAKDTAARNLSKQLKIKGFRPGKAPRSVVERMVGEDTLRSEAIDEALPGLVGTALEERELEPVVTPAVEDVRQRDGGGVEVDVRVTLWPSVDAVPDYERTIEVDVPDVSDDEVAAQIDRVRTQYAELEDVERPAGDGDFVMINLSAAGPLGDIPEVSATDLLYEVGSRSYIPGLDEMLVGVGVGAIKEGPATLPDGFGDHSGGEVTLRVLVKGVRSRKLPELTDEWVSDVSEYETVAELEDELRRGLLSTKLAAARGMFRDKLLGELIDDLGLDVPDALVQAEMESSFHNLSHSLESRGLDLATYLSVTGQDQQAFFDDLRQGAERSITTRVLLEGVAGVEGLSVDGVELDAAIAEMSESSRRPPEELRAALESSGQLSILTGDILRRKALDRILEASTAVDADGAPVDLTVPDDGDDIDDIDDDDNRAAGDGGAVEETDEIRDVAGDDETPASASVGREGADPDADEDL